MSLNQLISPNTLSQTISCRGLNIQNNTIPSYSPSTLNAYCSEIKSGITITGFTTTQSTSIIISRIGNVVTFNLPEKLAVSNGNPIVLQNAIDIKYRPVVNLNFVPVVVDTIAQVSSPNQLNGHLDLDVATGNITIYRTANHGSFNNTATAGYRAMSFSYICV